MGQASQSFPIGAEDEIRTRDLLLGKETRYRCATSAFNVEIISDAPAIVKEVAPPKPLGRGAAGLHCYHPNRRAERQIHLSQ